jgi:hypothetical protein
MKKNEELNLQWLIAFTVSDIDIFLLKEEDQETDKEQLYTKEEIRQQFEKTLCKILNVMSDCGYDIKTPLKANWFNMSEAAMKFHLETIKTNLPETPE